ncbi:N/A [soil metagenome]
MSEDAAMALLGLTLGLLILGLFTYDQGRLQRRVAGRRARLGSRSRQLPLWRRTVQAAMLVTPLGQSVDERLRRAGIEGLLAGDAIMVSLAGAAAVYVFSVKLVTPLAALILAVALLITLHRYLNRLVRKRAEKFAEQLPDIARIMSNAAGAGIAIPNAVALAARELEEPAKSLLSYAVRQMEVGQTLAGAMEQLQERAPSRELAVLVSTLIIQQRAGGDVIEALREMSVNLEVRRDLKREVDAMMAGVRFTAFAVMGLGVAVLFVLETIQRGTLRRLTALPIGQVVLIVAFSLFAVGYTAMRRVSRIDI